MRKSDLVNAIAVKADLNKEQAQHVLDSILEQIADAMERRDTVNLVGFGSFVARHRGARAGKNPQTGEAITIGASNTVAFRPGKGLREAVLPLSEAASAPTQAVQATSAPRTSSRKKASFAHQSSAHA